MAQDIDRKLRVTAAFLGAVTAKDLAAAFRRANPVTSFDVERAHKWIQGRARPRESRLYEDWAKVVDLDRPGAWIADCNLEDFIEVICVRHNCDRDMLERRVESSRRPSAELRPERNPSLAGTYACYQGGGLDQVDPPSYRALVDLFNPIWLAGATAMRGRVGEA
ncbi:MAG: hypothetical protein JF625_02940 [Inquilinus limosus]|uniref:Uncharacterized protein n=1 Tax=Inquilinus limosus TaxID=171674 RepID=A0A952KBT5_9PROT|nr:hypothetical protein [Inquilinus limosus]